MPDTQITAESIKQGKETLDDLENIKKKTDIVIKILEKLDKNSDEKVFREAENIFKNHYFTLKHSKIKRALSEAHLRRLLRERNGVTKIIASLKSTQKIIGKSIGYAKRINNYFDLYHKAKIMISKNRVSKDKNLLIQEQENLFADYKKMQALASVLKSVADKAPPFIKDYMSLTLDVFIKAEGAVKFFMNYGQKIIKSKDFKNMGENMQIIQNSTFNKNKLIYGSMTLD
jgi:hypothetical protein